MNTWHLEETRNHIVRLFGREQLELAGSCLRSVDDRQIYARLHYQDFQQSLDAYVHANLQDQLPMFVAWTTNDEAWQEFNLFIRRVGAYLVACIQSMHSMPDILAHAVYYSLGLNRSDSPLPLHKIGMSSVIKKLQREAEAEELLELLGAIGTGGESAHLSALANHCKHRSLVFPTLSEDWTGESVDRHTIMLPAFKYQGVLYPQVVANDFLKAEYERCSGLAVKVGNALNSMLRARPS